MNTTRSANTYLLEGWDASNDSAPITIPAILLVISIFRCLLERRECVQEGPSAKKGCCARAVRESQGSFYTAWERFVSTVSALTRSTSPRRTPRRPYRYRISYAHRGEAVQTQGHSTLTFRSTKARETYRPIDSVRKRVIQVYVDS